MKIIKAPCFLFPGQIKKFLHAAFAVFLVNMMAGISEDASRLVAFSQPRQALAEPAPAAEQPQGNGPQLLDKHCTSCHVIEKLTRYRKSKEQWEQTIGNMIKNDGVVLTEAEKTALVDYFVSLKKTAAKAP